MSSLAWIDFDEAERQRAQRIMALFQERESRDELGLGAIRSGRPRQRRDCHHGRLTQTWSVLHARHERWRVHPKPTAHLHQLRIDSAGLNASSNSLTRRWHLCKGLAQSI